MTEQTQDKNKKDEMEKFSDEQQEFFNKRMGEARVKARELAKADFEEAAKAATEKAAQEKLQAEKEWQKLATMHSDRVKELEPFEVEAMAYRAMVADLLKDRVKELGDKAKVAIKALPESLSDLEKLNWLNKVASEGAFATEETSRVGTPARRKKTSQVTDKGREQHRRLKL